MVTLIFFILKTHLNRSYYYRNDLIPKQYLCSIQSAMSQNIQLDIYPFCFKIKSIRDINRSETGCVHRVPDREKGMSLNGISDEC